MAKTLSNSVAHETQRRQIVFPFRVSTYATLWPHGSSSPSEGGFGTTNFLSLAFGASTPKRRIRHKRP
jgi:hypothetical protein